MEPSMNGLFTRTHSDGWMHCKTGSENSLEEYVMRDISKLGAFLPFWVLSTDLSNPAQLETQVERIRELESKLKATRDYANELESSLRTMQKENQSTERTDEIVSATLDTTSSTQVSRLDVSADGEPFNSSVPVVSQIIIRTFRLATCLVSLNGMDALDLQASMSNGNLNSSGLRVPRVDDLLLQETIRTFQSLITERDQELMQLHRHIRSNLSTTESTDQPPLILPQLFESAVQTDLIMAQADKLSGLADALAEGGMLLTAEQNAALTAEIKQSLNVLSQNDTASEQPDENGSTDVKRTLGYADLLSNMSKLRQEAERMKMRVALSELALTPNTPVETNSKEHSSYSESKPETLQAEIKGSDYAEIICETLRKLKGEDIVGSLQTNIGTIVYEESSVLSDSPQVVAPSTCLVDEVETLNNEPIVRSASGQDMQPSTSVPQSGSVCVKELECAEESVIVPTSARTNQQIYIERQAVPITPCEPNSRPIEKRISNMTSHAEIFVSLLDDLFSDVKIEEPVTDRDLELLPPSSGTPHISTDNNVVQTVERFDALVPDRISDGHHQTELLSRVLRALNFTKTSNVFINSHTLLRQSALENRLFLQIKSALWNMVVNPVLAHCPRSVLDTIVDAIQPSIRARLYCLAANDRHLLFIILFRIFCALHFEPACLIPSVAHTTNCHCHSYAVPADLQFKNAVIHGYHTLRSRDDLVGSFRYYFYEIAHGLWLLTGIWPSFMGTKWDNWTADELWMKALFFKAALLQLIFGNESDSRTRTNCLQSCVAALASNRAGQNMRCNLWLPTHRLDSSLSADYFLLTHILVTAIVDLLRAYPVPKTVKCQLAKAAKLLNIPHSGQVLIGDPQQDSNQDRIDLTCLEPTRSPNFQTTARNHDEKLVSGNDPSLSNELSGTSAHTPKHYKKQLQELKQTGELELARAHLSVSERRRQELERRVLELGEELARARAEARAAETSLSAARRTEAALRRRLLVAMDMQGTDGDLASHRHSTGANFGVAVEAQSTLELQASALYEDMLREYSESRSPELSWRTRDRSRSNYRQTADRDAGGRLPVGTKSTITTVQLQERISELESENFSLKEGMKQLERDKCSVVSQPVGRCTAPACLEVRRLLKAFQERFTDVMGQLTRTQQCLDALQSNSSEPKTEMIDSMSEETCLGLITSVQQQLSMLGGALKQHSSSGAKLDDSAQKLISCSNQLSYLAKWLRVYLRHTDAEILQLRSTILHFQISSVDGEHTITTASNGHGAEHPVGSSTCFFLSRLLAC
ncbi:hypothetical protein AHF37_05130 [Paragonimus kellicotti]|nr:hypothetical protein AHF37_05130 [Paragonimus kellicotti]